jgi:hypothetical protein
LRRHREYIDKNRELTLKMILNIISLGSGEMTKKEKLLEKIRNNPKTVRFGELDLVLRDVGFECRQPSGGSSHYTYIIKDKTLTVPFKRPYVKVIYVKMAIKILDELGI